MNYKVLLCSLLCAGSLQVNAQKNPVFTESQFKDDLTKEWCYLKKSATVIGMPFQSRMALVTYDGTLYTGEAELSFFYGKEKLPMFARQKTWLNGWIPVVQYDWTDEHGIDYAIEMFAYPLDGYSEHQSVNFVKMTVKNQTDRPQQVYLTAATRGRLDDYRYERTDAFDDNRLLEMTGNGVTLADKLIYAYPSDYSQLYSKDAMPYVKPFVLKDKGIDVQTPCGAVEYSQWLGAGAEKSYVFKMPLVPAESKSDFVKAVYDADYDEYRNKTIAYWKDKILSQSIYTLPEKRINDGYKASMVHLLLATRKGGDGDTYQTDGIPYQNFFLTSGPQMVLAYLSMGANEEAKMIVSDAIRQQEPDGLYFDRSLAHGGVIPAAHGHILYCIGSYWLYTHDKEFIDAAFPSLEKAINYIRTATKENQYGLLPPTYQYDNEMIDGHYACTNYWTLLGLRYAIRMAKELGRDELAVEWSKLEKEYAANILKGIKAVVGSDGYVRTGLHEFKTGSKDTQRGFSEFRSDNDWENMLLAYPIELLPEDHPYVKGTLKHVRKSYAEGIMTYRHGMHLHQYITANMIEQYMVRGDSRQALIDFYHIILHGGSTHEGFENMVLPWKDRNVASSCLPPHAWASAKTAVLTRNFLLYEYGGRSGLNEGRSLYLMSVLSPEWLKDGDSICIRNAQCEMGVIDATLTTTGSHATISYQAKYSKEPGSVKFRIPYFKKIKSFKSDDKSARIIGDCIVLDPSFTTLEIEWTDKKEMYRDNFAYLLELYRDCNVFEGIQDPDQTAKIRLGKKFVRKSEKDGRQDTLNFETVKKSFLHEMNRRHAEGEVVDLSDIKL